MGKCLWFSCVNYIFWKKIHGNSSIFPCIDHYKKYLNSKFCIQIFRLFLLWKLNLAEHLIMGPINTSLGTAQIMFHNFIDYIKVSKPCLMLILTHGTVWVTRWKMFTIGCLNWTLMENLIDSYLLWNGLSLYILCIDIDVRTISPNVHT